jgi:hypothetical protein
MKAPKGTRKHWEIHRFQISAPSPTPSQFEDSAPKSRSDLCRATAFRLKIAFDLCLVAAEVLPQNVQIAAFHIFPSRVLERVLDDKAKAQQFRSKLPLPCNGRGAPTKKADHQIR